MSTIYLRADGLDFLKSSLVSAGLATQDPSGNLELTYGVSLDLIGEISIFDGDVLVQNIPGYHANLRLVDMELTPTQLELLPVIPDPVTPFRVWA